MRPSTLQKMFAEELARLGTDDALHAYSVRPRNSLFDVLAPPLALTALILAVVALAWLYSAPAHADEPQTPPGVERCDSIEQLEEQYPQSTFTKLSPEEIKRVLDKMGSPEGAPVETAYSVPFPPDPHMVVLHAYNAKGCWIGAAQMPYDAFEHLVRGQGV